jgi:hypothetical protein
LCSARARGEELPLSSLFAKRLLDWVCRYTAGVSLISPPIGSTPLRRSRSDIPKLAERYIASD